MSCRLIVSMLIVAGLAACAPGPSASIPNPTDIGATALALANSMLAETPQFGGQVEPGYVGATAAAVGTPVPLPVTGGLGTLAPGLSGGVNCNHILSSAASGGEVRLAIRNHAKGPITVTIGLSKPNAYGQCGYLTWPAIGKQSKLVVNVPATAPGDTCYWANVLISYRNSQAIIGGKSLCLSPTQRWALDINDSRISLSSP